MPGALAVQYGMQAKSLAAAANLPEYEARELLQLLREKFRRFYRWATDMTDRAMLGLPIETALGWRIRATADAKAGTFRNFPVQAAGAEMLRLACILATEAGLPVCWPVHDALLIEAAINDIDNIIEAVRSIMWRVSEVVTRGLRIRVGVDVVRYPERYMDPRGRAMWQTVVGLLGVVRETTQEWSQRPQIRGLPDHPPVVPGTTPDPRQS
jgi:DNA polymerase I-like protein with 3'-5' exonuclease and polymerase domains